MLLRDAEVDNVQERADNVREHGSINRQKKANAPTARQAERRQPTPKRGGAQIQPPKLIVEASPLRLRWLSHSIGG